MNEIAKPDVAARRSVTHTMAHRFGMEADTFLATLTATVFSKGMTREEQAAFLLVADHHNLNPVTREIYAMPKKGGGIIPVVSIDGWVRMANEHPAFDGMEFEDHHEEGKLVSTTCRIFRKDRSHPVAVTEYLEECKRDTEPWKMKHRMLRHKSMIQCARYAFGFAGIYDPDEAERFAEPLVGPRGSSRAPSPPAAPPTVASAPAAPQIEHEHQPPPAPVVKMTLNQVREAFRERAKAATTAEELGEAWNDFVEPNYDRFHEGEQEELCVINRQRAAELPGDEP